MVLAFLSAELYSTRFSSCIHSQLGDLNLVLSADLTDATANQKRRSVLAACRGYRRNTYLFVGFPAPRDVRWKLVEVTINELGAFLYANYPTWIDLSQGSRLVRDGAANAGMKPGDETKERIRAIERDIRNGSTYPAIIAIAEGEDQVHVLLEGHTRASAYVRAHNPRDTCEVIVGYACAFSGWVFF